MLESSTNRNTPRCQDEAYLPKAVIFQNKTHIDSEAEIYSLKLTAKLPSENGGRWGFQSFPLGAFRCIHQEVRGAQIFHLKLETICSSIPEYASLHEGSPLTTPLSTFTSETGPKVNLLAVLLNAGEPEVKQRKKLFHF